MLTGTLGSHYYRKTVDNIHICNYYHHFLTTNLPTILLGSHLQLTSPALEFVKAATHVMALDPLLAQEVASLRRLLLTQVCIALN